MHQSSEQYIGLLNGELVCHTGIIQMPMNKGKKRVHRLVVLPDYQGIGIGTKFIKEVAKIIDAKGYELNLTTTTPALVNALLKDEEWILSRFGREKNNFDGFNRYKENNVGHLNNTTSVRRITYSFWYKKRSD